MFYIAICFVQYAQRYTLISPILAEDEFNKNIKSYILKLKLIFKNLSQ